MDKTKWLILSVLLAVLFVSLSLKNNLKDQNLKADIFSSLDQSGDGIFLKESLVTVDGDTLVSPNSLVTESTVTNDSEVSPSTYYSNPDVESLPNNNNDAINDSSLTSPSQSPDSVTIKPSLSPKAPSPIVSPKESVTNTPTPLVELLPSSSKSPNPSVMMSVMMSVVINEIGWMGTESSAVDEWLELFNNSDQIIDLGGWVLKSDDGSPNINLSGTISPRSYFLIERTNDETISDITADLVSSFGRGGLKNTGENLFLIDGSGEIIDSVSSSEGWFAGDNDSKYSMERVNSAGSGPDPANWNSNSGNKINGLDSAGNQILGTPRSRNSQPSF